MTPGGKSNQNGYANEKMGAGEATDNAGLEHDYETNQIPERGSTQPYCTVTMGRESDQYHFYREVYGTVFQVPAVGANIAHGLTLSHWSPFKARPI